MFTIHPYVNGDAATGYDLSIFAGATIAPFVFGMNSGDIADWPELNSAQIQAEVASKIATFSITGARLCMWEWESAFLNEWEVADMVTAQNASELGYTPGRWGGYHLPLADMNKATEAELAAVVALNDSFATVIAACQVHMPDFYPQDNVGASMEAIMRVNIAEVKRAVAAHGTTPRIVPWLYTKIPAGDPVTSSIFIRQLRGLQLGGITEFVLAAPDLTNQGERDEFDETMEDWAGAYRAAFPARAGLRSGRFGRVTR